MSRFEDDHVGFTLPAPIRDFVFDLYEAVRRSNRVDDVGRLYEHKYKEITDKYFAKSPWPESKAIASEANSDETFLLLYNEMTMRHVTTKLKPQLNDHLSSWRNYKQLFKRILTSSDTDIMLTSQWTYDIMQEFAYQFQGFCQFRCQAGSHNTDILELLRQNEDAWNATETFGILKSLIQNGRARSGNSFTVVQQFGYFASIELARLECLMSDYSASLAAVSHVRLNDRSELFARSPICFFNLFYHIGVSQMMLGRFEEAISSLSDCVLFVMGLQKPGGGSQLRSGMQSQINRMMEKALSLLAVLITVTPAYRVEDQVKIAVEAKFDEKMKRLAGGDATSATELFESACPKFISPAAVDFTAPRSIQGEVMEQQVKALVDLVMQQVPFLKLRSFLGLYKSIDLVKLARFSGTNEADLTSQLMAYKLNRRDNELHFFIDNGVLIVDKAPTKQDTTLATERHFLAGIRKQREMSNSVLKTFSDLKF